jgi:hypothetical protein
MAAAGTLELLLREVSRALGVLPDRIADKGVDGLFVDLGLRPPPGLVTGDVKTAIEEATTAAGDLPDLIAGLSDAIEQDDLALIVAAGAKLAPKLAAVIAAIAHLGTAVGKLADTLAGLTPEQRQQLAAFAGLLPGRLAELLLIGYLRDRTPGAAAWLELLRVIVRVDEPGDPNEPLAPPFVRSELHLERLPQLVTAPDEWAREAYDWGEPGFDGVAMLAGLRRFLDEWLSIPAMLLTPAAEPALLEAFLFALRVDDTLSPPGLAISLRFPGAADFHGSYPLRGPWALTTAVSAAFAADVQGTIAPPASLTLRPPAGELEASVRFGLRAERPDGEILLLGLAGGTGLRARAIAVAFPLSVAWDSDAGEATLTPRAEAELSGGKLVVGLGGADGFLASALPKALQLDADLAATWDPVSGLVVHGGAGLTVMVPLTLALGPGRLEQLTLAVRIDEAGLGFDARVAGSIKLGPFTAAIDGIGAGVTLALTEGNLGPANLALRFLPPTGLGLAIAAGPVQGGGFIKFDEPAGRYGGVLALKLTTIGLGAIGLLDTKLPGGAKGFALLIAIRAEFPPIQVGFGIALSAVGGLLALNRRVDVDALRQRFAAGAVGRILAPEDPIRNAPLLLQELGAIFPVTPGVTVLGPTLQLSWAELVRLDLGLFLELPGPTKIVLLGSARATIENPADGSPYLQIRLDILGVLDFSKRVLEFDAVLIDSQLLEVFQLTGGAAFRLSWGDEPYIVLTIGGFHPSYNPAPLAFPSSLTRVAMTRGQPSDLLYLRFEGYLAVTTNTLQFGAAVQLIVNAGPIRAEGSFKFDALIRFQPFSFEFSFEASVRVSFKGLMLAGVRISGVLSGPGPVTFTGELTFEILFFKISWSATFTLGSSTPPEIDPVASALPVLGEELRKPGNLSTAAAEDPYVALTPPKAPTLPVLAPLGGLVWTQKRAPLGLLLQRFEGAPLERHETISAATSQASQPAADWFAPGTFAQLSDSDALTRRSFERLQGGVRIGAADDVHSAAVTHDVMIEQYRIGVEPLVRPADAVPDWMQTAINRREGVEGVPTPPPAITIEPELWAVTTPAGEVVATGLPEAQAHQLAKLEGNVAIAAGDRIPELAF